MKSQLEYYKIIDADYAFVGLKSSMDNVAKSAVDVLRGEGMRVGLLVLPELLLLNITIASLLSQVRAVGVVESRKSENQIIPALVKILSRASAAPGWHAPGRIPRVYSAMLDPGCSILKQEHLVGLAKAMRTYEPEHILLTADGVVMPITKVSETSWH